jgi:hypothetical protein
MEKLAFIEFEWSDFDWEAYWRNRFAVRIRAAPRRVAQTVTAVWKKQGRLALTADGKVDVEATEKLLALRPETYRGGKVKAKPVKAGKKPARTAKESPPSANYPWKGNAYAAPLAPPDDDEADDAVPILDRTPETSQPRSLLSIARLNSAKSRFRSAI